jgi:hypothetical protein
VITPARTAATTAALRRTTHLLVFGGGSSACFESIARQWVRLDEWLWDDEQRLAAPKR